MRPIGQDEQGNHVGTPSRSAAIVAPAAARARTTLPSRRVMGVVAEQSIAWPFDTSTLNPCAIASRFAVTIRQRVLPLLVRTRT